MKERWMIEIVALFYYVNNKKTKDTNNNKFICLINSF